MAICCTSRPLTDEEIQQRREEARRRHAERRAAAAATDGEGRPEGGGQEGEGGNAPSKMVTFSLGKFHF